MSRPRVRCQVLETSARAGRRGAPRYRDLLPWADPYIARLMNQLDRRYDAPEHSADDHPLMSDDSPTSAEAWEADDFLPCRLDQPRPTRPSVYGGWPLLDDLGVEQDEETV